MATINGWRFKLIVYRYNCTKTVLVEVKEAISNKYYLSNKPKLGVCLVTITDNAKRWVFPLRKDRYFDIAFTYRGVLPGVQGKEGGVTLRLPLKMQRNLLMKNMREEKKLNRRRNF